MRRRVVAVSLNLPRMFRAGSLLRLVCRLREARRCQDAAKLKQDIPNEIHCRSAGDSGSGDYCESWVRPEGRRGVDALKRSKPGISARRRVLGGSWSLKR